MKQYQIGFLFLCLMIYQGAEAQFLAPDNVFGNGGGELRGGNYKIEATVGQTTDCIISDSSFKNGTGYWYLIVIKRLSTGTNGNLRATYVVQAYANPLGMQDTVRIQIIDPDLNSNDTQKNTASVKMENAVSGEIENIQLEETSNNSGIFRGKIPTTYGTSGTDNDGMLAIAAWDTVFAQYCDNLTTTGKPDTLKAMTFVVNLFGDASGNGSIRAYDAHSILAIVSMR